MRVQWSAGLALAVLLLGCPGSKPGAPDPSHSSVTADRIGSIVANGRDRVTLTVLVRDAGGKPVPGTLVQLSVSGGGNSLGAPPLTDSSGRTSATLSSSVAEGKTVTATLSQGALSQVSLAFVAGPVSASTSRVVASPGPLTADGQSAVTLTVTLRDDSNNPVVGQSVTLFASGDQNSFVQPGASDANGVAVGKLSSTRAGQKELTATAQGVLLQGPTVTFDPGPPVVVGGLIHYVTDTGEVTVPLDLSADTIGAWFAEADGGFTWYPVTGTDAGTLTLANVPLQSYYLQYDNDYLVTSARSVDLGYYTQGRPDVRFADAGTWLHTTLTGMNPWQFDARMNGDDLQMYSSNAGLLIDNLYTFDGDGGTPNLGDTTFDQWTDYGRVAANADPRRVDSARGDQALFTQLVTHYLGDPDAGIAYESVGRAYTSSTLTVNDGQAGRLSGAFSTVPQKSYSLDLKVDEATPGSYGSYRTAVNPNASIQYNWLYLDVIPTPAHGPFGPNPDLILYTPPFQYTRDQAVTLSYGDPYPSGFSEFVEVQMRYRVGYPFSLPDGGTAAAGVSAYVGNRDLAASVQGSPLKPALSPVQNPQIDGRSAFSDQTITPTPTVSWTPPAVGTPTHYQVQFRELSVDTVGLASYGSVTRVLTEGTRVKVPPGLLGSGRTYALRISALYEPGHSLAAPYHYQFPDHFADVLSGLLTVR